MKLEVGKLYRHHMVNGPPGQTIRGCFVKRGAPKNNGLSGWQGGINTIGDITEYAHAMMLIELHYSDNNRSPELFHAYGVFLVGDRYIILDPDVVDPV